MGYKKRLNRKFDEYGTAVTINGTTPTSGFFEQLDQARMNMFFDSIEQASINRPALIAFFRAETNISIGDTIALDGRTYTVAKLSSRRLKDEVIMQVALLT